MNQTFKKVTGSILLGVFVITAGGYSASAQENRPKPGSPEAYGEATPNGRRAEQRKEAVGEARENLSDADKSILEEARALQAAGDKEAARAYLGENGIVPPRQEVKEAMMENKDVMEEARELRESGDGEAAKALLDEAGLEPKSRNKDMRYISEEDREVMEEARELREAGDRDAAKDLLDESGLKPRPKGPQGSSVMQTLSDEQVLVLEEAQELRKSGDGEAAKALLEEAGIKPKPKAEQKAEIRAIKEDARVLRESGDVEGARSLIKSSILADRLDRGTKQNLTEQQQEALDNAKLLRESGDVEGARALVQEAGIELKKPKFNKEIRQSATDAVSTGNYEAWASIASETRFADKNEVSEASFEVLSEAKTLYDSGDSRGAKTLLKEAGFKFAFWEGASKYLGK